MGEGILDYTFGKHLFLAQIFKLSLRCLSGVSQVSLRWVSVSGVSQVFLSSLSLSSLLALS